MKKETQLYKDLIAELSHQCVSNGYFHHFVRIESNYTQQGIPDINGCINGHEFWIECKWNSELLPLQISWREQRQKAGGKVFLVTNCKDIFKDGGYSLFFYNRVYNYHTVEFIAIEIIKEVVEK